MDWYLFWTAFGSVFTALACFIALFYPLYEHRKKLKLSLKLNQTVWTIDNSMKECYCSISIVNNSKEIIYIYSACLLINGKYFHQIIDPYDANRLYQIIYKNPLPYPLKVNEKIEINYSTKGLQDFLKNKEIDFKSPIFVVVKDSNDKEYKLKTKYEVKDILNKILE